MTMPPRRQIEVVQRSLVDAGTDAVVNPSNSSAALGGGVSRALFDECGGRALQQEMREKLEDEFDGALEEGDCLITSAGTSRKFKHILHVQAVDYRGTKAMHDGNVVRPTVTSQAKIQAATFAALEAAADLATRESTDISIAFPLLGAGSGGLSAEASLTAMVAGLREYFRETPDAPISRIVFAVPEPDRFELCQRRVRSQFATE